MMNMEVVGTVEPFDVTAKILAAIPYGQRRRIHPPP
jgi:hypothetical protein